MAQSKKFMAVYGANVAGFLYNAGTALQFIFGIIALSPREIASAIFNIASPCSFLLFGHRNWGVAAGAVLGTIGTLLAVYPQIANGEIGSIFGFASFCVFVSFSIFSTPLSHHFAHADKAIVRHTLGHPRRLCSVGLILFARTPIIAECVTHSRWKLASVFGLWTMGDVAFSFSRSQLKK